MNEALDALRKIAYFSEIDGQLQKELAQHAQRVSLEAGEILLIEGERSQTAYVVESGWLKSSKSSLNGREHVLQFIGAGETINEMNVLTDTTNSTTITALETSVLYAIRRDVILSVLHRYPQLAQIMVQKLADTVQFLFTVIEDMSLRSIEARLARYLLDQASGDTLYRPKWATQAELANHLGTVPNVLHRTLKNLEQEGLIKVERQQIKILDAQGLVQRASLDK
ncbi:MAG: Crp/Fnr family transcriptional regulator [Anaerolineae bacterium]|mgnify:FL=1|jgi:CRP/FNR family transcriptional regulator|nr:Crp/Fnr family transcriptional regulator [Chloroflexota bacterium]MBN8636385.1 Crp/Fnr family transcriptional regulator [Anaerolineae bacterium]